MTELTVRELLLMLYQHAVDAVDGQYRVQQWLAQQQQKQPPGFTHCVAIGKAAPAMLQGALSACPSLTQSLLIAPAMQISRSLRHNKNINCIASSHPVPDEKSLQAGEALLTFLSVLPDDAMLLFLISGGSSALVEKLRDNISLQQCQQINRYLLASGKSIVQINAWRRYYSKIKAGGLLQYIKPAHCTQLLISDVADDDMAVIGSGLLVASDSVPDKDDYLHKLFSAQGLPTPHLPPANTEKVSSTVIANNHQALAGCARAAEAEGFCQVIHDQYLTGEAIDVADMIADYLTQAKPGIHIWGGETTVTLPEKPGIGGRSQQFALRLASRLTGTDIHVLAAGTDGIDGNSHCAGAAVSARTIEKAAAMGIDINLALEKANAGMVLMATDDLIQPGPTGTNVADIIIAYIPAVTE